MITIFLPNSPTPPDPSIFIDSNSKSIIFFDEILSGYVLVDGDFDQMLGFLDISVVSDEDSFIVQSLELDQLKSHTLEDQHKIIYEFEVPVTYPKRKLTNPFLVLTAKLIPKLEKNVMTDEFLRDFEPNGRNLLSGWQGKSLLLRENTSETGNKVIPNHIVIDQEPIRKSLKLPIISPLIIKLKSTKPAGKNNILLTSFNIETSESLRSYDHTLRIQLINFHLDFNGNAECFNDTTYPIDFNSEESLNLNYRLVNLSDEVLQPLTITIDLKVCKFDVSISNQIITSWIPYIDFNLVAPPINSSLKYTVNNSTGSLLKKRAVSKKFNSTSSVMVNLANANSNLFGLKLTFTGKLNVKLGEIVNWKLQAINSSFNKLNLSLIVNKSERSNNQVSQIATQVQIQPNSNNIQSNPHSNGHSGLPAQSSSANSQPVLSSVQPVQTNSNSLTTYNAKTLYNLLKLDTTGIIILNNDIRINLEPNSVFEINLNIMGISKGIFNLEGVNIYDLANGDCIDFGKLVEVFVT